jgi:hypothetical protein
MVQEDSYITEIEAESKEEVYKLTADADWRYKDTLNIEVVDIEEIQEDTSARILS